MAQRTVATETSQRLTESGPSRGADPGEIILTSRAAPAIDPDRRTLTVIASDGSTDRAGDIVRPEGWKLAAFRKNPVFLWQHRSSEPPIGRVQAIGVAKTGDHAGRLMATVEFLEAGVYELADLVFRLYQDGFLRAVSVGFRPLKMQDILDAKGNWTGVEFLEQELLELSAVNVPANPNAVAVARSLGFRPALIERVFADTDYRPATRARWRRRLELMALGDPSRSVIQAPKD